MRTVQVWRFWHAVIIVALLVLFAQKAAAHKPVLLSVERANHTTVELTLADLDALPQQHFATTTQWTEGKQVFSGPALADVFALAKIDTGSKSVTHLIAANDYEVVLDNDLIEPTLPILATRIDGKTFNARNKGPLWVVFPYDSDVKYQSESVYAASIWQLVEVKTDEP